MFCQLPRDAASKVGESRLGVGKHVEDAVAAVLELEREPGEGAVFLLDDLATAAQELLR
ncbi:MAG: hypothetical protein QOJ78_677 [Pseudonocardiales bacterium]|jgi:hypothetical protein|nr:hypothetical protein [Pseudonocardiales bacterium]